MQIKDLKPNKFNPRKISSSKKAKLLESLKKYGDLSGFVFNKRTNTLISGHQRSSVLPQNGKIKIEHKYEVPTASKTVAEGYVEIEGERFKYREVDADKAWETEALLAANKHGGEWDHDTLKVLIADNPSIDIELAGFDIPELKAMDIQLPDVSTKNIEISPNGPVSSEDTGEESDEQYVKNTPETTEQIDTENPNNHVDSRDAFESINEKTEVEKRFLIMIDCNDQEHKDELRKKLHDLVKESGARIF